MGGAAVSALALLAATPGGAVHWPAFGGDGGRSGYQPVDEGDIRLSSPIVAIAPSATGSGYAFTAADGGVFVFGDVPILGAAAEPGRLNRPVVTLAVKP
ncbi:MAG: hypothetical protein M3P34_01165 [Actinomycetota bacterium]|nr:hypothetical protein [Actinomycetota bacterium]